MRKLSRLGVGLVFLLAAGLPAKEPPIKESPAVLELLEDNAGALIPLLNNDGGLDATKAHVEWRDVFSGVSSLRVSAMQRFSARMPNWNYAIVEKPGPGQYRYLRFAWKRTQSPGIMIQLHNANGSWNQRYLAGPPSPSVRSWGPMLTIAPQGPADWVVVTRDLFKDFGPLNITGMAFTPMEGDGVGLFDHFYLGRTVADLDRVTAQALGQVPLEKPLTRNQLETLWKDLAGVEGGAGQAWRTLIAGSKESVPFIQEQLKKVSASPVAGPKITQWIDALDDEDFLVRENAFKELKRSGPVAVAPMRKAYQETASAEVRRRLEILLEKFLVQDAQLTPEQLRLARAIRVLEKAGTPQAQAALEDLARQTLEAGLNDEVRRALERMGREKK